MTIPRHARPTIEPVRVALVRHGETDWNIDGRLQGSSDIPLNDVGRRQARDTAVELATGEWTTIVSSPLSRAAETADIIGHVIGLTRTADVDDFAERRFGRAEGLTNYEAWAYWPDGEYPGAESGRAVTARVRRGLDALALEYAGKSVIAVAHGGVIRSILHSITGHPAPRIANAGITMLVGDGTDWIVESVNSIPMRRRRR